MFDFTESEFLKELRCTCLTAGESNTVVLQHLCIFVERVIYGNHLASVLVSCCYKHKPSILNWNAFLWCFLMSRELQVLNLLLHWCIWFCVPAAVIHESWAESGKFNLILFKTTLNYIVTVYPYGFGSLGAYIKSFNENSLLPKVCSQIAEVLGLPCAMMP